MPIAKYERKEVTMTKQKPIKEYRIGHIKVAVWKNESEDNGKTIVKYSIQIQKSYRDEDGEYRDTNNYFPEELPKLSLAVSKAFEFTALKERNPEDDS